MSKNKKEIQPIRPSECIQSLSLFNEKVLQLTHVCSMIINHGLNDVTKEYLSSSLEEVNKFYNYDN